MLVCVYNGLVNYDILRVSIVAQYAGQILLERVVRLHGPLPLE